jgi:replication factor C subunit 3/5
LICNYISRIDEGLQNEFLRLRFNQLPKEDIILFLKNISEKEELKLELESIKQIQNLYGSDMRSMINFMQSNQNVVENQLKIIDNKIWEKLYNHLEKNESMKTLNSYIYQISINYNIDKKNIIKDFLNYIIRNKQHVVTFELLNFIENIMHNNDLSHYIYYVLVKLKLFFSKALCS